MQKQKKILQCMEPVHPDLSLAGLARAQIEKSMRDVEKIRREIARMTQRSKHR